jgi:hypothetical protein
MAVARKLLLPEDGAETSGKLIAVDQMLTAFEDDLRARGADTYNARWPRKHLPPSLLRKPVVLATDKELLAWRNRLIKNGKAASTANRICGPVLAAVKLAVGHHPPAWKVGLEKLPDAQVARNVVLPDSKVCEFIDASYRHEEALGLFVEVAAIAGPRPSQIGAPPG